MRRIFMGLALALLVTGCADQECDFHSECGRGSYCARGRCERDCAADFDCPMGRYCSVIGQCLAGTRPDSGTAELDAAVPRDAGPRDAGPFTFDAGPRDAGPLLIDAGPVVVSDGGPILTDAGPLGRYLDRCSIAGDCESGQCVDDIGGTRMCTKTCTLHNQCASEHFCVDGLCRPDDTGRSCTMPAQCGLALCAGVEGFTGECTRPCGNALDCPAGFACTQAGGIFICADIERPYDGTCLELAAGRGCTATCRNVNDCPRTFGGIPYTCTTLESVCAPHAAVIGPDPIGAAVRYSGPNNLCRGGASVDDAVLGELCTQACSEQGGCGPGFGCVPLDDGTLFCQRGGAGALTSVCASEADCASSICEVPGFCSRLCTLDGLCPTGLVCTPRLGGVSTCQFP